METIDYDMSSENDFKKCFDMSIHRGTIVTVDYANDKCKVLVQRLTSEGGSIEVDNIPIFYHCEGIDEVKGGSSAFEVDDEVYLTNEKGKCDSDATTLKVVGFVHGLKACLALCLIPNRHPGTRQYYNLQNMALKEKTETGVADFYSYGKNIYDALPGQPGPPSAYYHRWEDRIRRAKNANVIAFATLAFHVTPGIAAYSSEVQYHIYDYEYTNSIAYSGFFGSYFPDPWNGWLPNKIGLTISDDGKDIWFMRGVDHYVAGFIQDTQIFLVHLHFNGVSWSTNYHSCSLNNYFINAGWNRPMGCSYCVDLNGCFYFRHGLPPPPPTVYDRVAKMDVVNGTFTDSYLIPGGNFLMDWDTTADCLRVMNWWPTVDYDSWYRFDVIPQVYYRPGYSKTYLDFSVNGFCGIYPNLLELVGGNWRNKFEMTAFHEASQSVLFTVDDDWFEDPPGTWWKHLNLNCTHGVFHPTLPENSDYDYVFSVGAHYKRKTDEFNGFVLGRASPFEFVDLESYYSSQSHLSEVSPLITLESFKT